MPPVTFQYVPRRLGKGTSLVDVPEDCADDVVYIVFIRNLDLAATRIIPMPLLLAIFIFLESFGAGSLVNTDDAAL